MRAEGQLRVAIAQFTAAIGDVRANLAGMGALLAEAAGRRADLLCFPELCLPGYLLDQARYDAPFLADLRRGEAALQSDACRLGVRIMYGTARRQAGLLYNLVVVTERDGGQTDYAKAHMVEAERSVFAAGHELVLACDGELGLGCCYDLAFPRFSASLADAGASVLVFPMAWERERAFVFERIVAARAIENVAYVVCANQSGAPGTLDSTAEVRSWTRWEIPLSRWASRPDSSRLILTCTGFAGCGLPLILLAIRCWLTGYQISRSGGALARFARALTEAVDKPWPGTLIP
jgi:predicted amidohydrolase